MSAPEPQALLALQQLDTRLDQDRHRRATLPERALLAELERQLAAGAAARAEVAARATEIGNRQAGWEAEMAGAEERLAEIDRRLRTGGVSAAREVTALSDSAAHLRERISDLEDRILTAMDERAPLDDQLAAVDTELSALDRRQAEASEALRAAEAAVDAEIAELGRARAEAAGELAPDRLSEYERLRPRLGGVAVARLIGSRCDGCHLTLPATELDQLRRLPADAVAHCEQCGRILVRTEA